MNVYFGSYGLNTQTGVGRVYQAMRHGVAVLHGFTDTPTECDRGFIENPLLIPCRIPNCGVFVPDIIPLLEEGPLQAFARVEYSHLDFYEWLMVPSEWTKATIVEHLGIDPGKIVVVPHGVDAHFKRIPIDRLAWRERLGIGAGRPVVGHISAGYPRKNIARIMAACDMIGAAFIRPSSLSEADLVEFYNAIDCFAFPSLSEGFGLPALEAQACGCPTVLSNTGALAEIAGPGSVMVDPASVDSIAEGILEALNMERREPGAEWRGRFNWDNTSHAVARWLNDGAFG